MKKIKRCLLIFCVFLVVAASLFPCSASLADEGYLWDSEGGFWYLPKSESADEETTTRRSGPLRAPAASGTGTTIAFPDFDKNKIDVVGFPDYVKQMIASPTSFTWVIVFQSTFYIYVADGCFPGVASLTGNLFIVNAASTVDSLKNGFVNYGYNPYVYACYVGHYSWSASDTLYSDFFDSDSWQPASSKKVNREETNKYFFTYPIPTSFSKKVSDFYCFGSVSFRNADLVSFAYPLASGGNIQSKPGSWADTVSGYNTWIYNWSSGESKFRFIDGGTFPTAESQQAETQRGILGQLKALPDKIRGFFETLENRLLWFSDDGSASYTNPFDNLLDDVKTKINGYITDVDNFNATLNDTLASVVSYVEQGSGAIQLFLTGVPLVSAFLLFFVVFAVVRKVVGR